MNLRTLIEERAAEFSAKDFLFYREQRYTYGEMDTVTNRAANALSSIGVAKGSRVAIMLPNCPEYIFVWFALSKLGAVSVLINIQLTGQFLRQQIGVGESEVMVTQSQFGESLIRILPDLPFLKRIIFLKSTDQDNPSGVEIISSFWDWISGFPDQPPPIVEIEDSHPVSIMFTSGTTGPSKGVLNGQKAYMRCGSDCASLVGLDEGDRCYLVLPLYHGNPQMMATMSALWIGGSLAISERFSASKFFDEVRRYNATYFTYIGTILSILCKQPERPDDYDNPLRLAFGGGAPISEWRILQERFGITIYEAYGMIEAGCVTTINRKGTVKLGSVGIPRDCMEIRIADEKDEGVPFTQVGEILVRPKETFVTFEGYYKNPEATLESYRNLWFHTGDKGEMDEDGFLYFKGRVKNTIRRKGENISPETIEEVINRFPKVLESAVVGVPDEIAGEEIKAYVILKPHEAVSPQHLIAWCREGLPEFMVPRFIEFRSRFEKTGSEKIKKYKLKEAGIGNAWDRFKNM